MTIVIDSLTEMWGHRVNGKTLGEIEIPSGTGSFDTGLCVMQMVNVAIHGASYFGGSKPSDAPSTDGDPIDGVVSSFAISLNDALGQGPRQRLREYVIQIANTTYDPEIPRQTVMDEARLRGFVFAEPFVAKNVRKAFQTLDAIIAGRVDMLPAEYAK